MTDETLALSGAPLPAFGECVNAPIGTTPVMRAGSVRRTMTIDVHWPDGLDCPPVVEGRARDRLAAQGGVLQSASLRARLTGRVVTELSLSGSDGAPIDTAPLCGLDAGGELRKAFASLAPQEREAGTLRHLLVDDMAGVSLVSRWAPNYWRSLQGNRDDRPPVARVMEGLCIGFRPGSSALQPDGRRKPSPNVARLAPLVNPADPDGWHVSPELQGMNFRRARRIDVWKEAGGLAVSCHFQDSASDPRGGDRAGIHEYAAQLAIGADGTIVSVTATPGTLPYAECRAAPVNLDMLVGTAAADLRKTVGRHLKGTAGCTHLNDVMRSFADVPALAATLR